MNFEETNIVEKLISLSDDEVDKLPFGVVKLSEKGLVKFYNKYESELAGLKPSDVLDRNFFVEIAPCTNNYMVAQRYLDQENLDETIDYVFTYKLSPTRVRLRILRKSSHSSGFFLVQLQED